MIFSLYIVDFMGKVLFFCFSGLILCALVLLTSFIAYSGGEPWIWSKIKNKYWIPLVLAGILVLTPSEKTMYLMLSAKVMKEVVVNDQVSGIGTKSLKLLEQKLDEMIGEKK